MTAEGTQWLVVDKHRLHHDFRHIRRALEDYRDALVAPDGDADAEVVAALRAGHLGLLQARVSLGSVELACALLQHVLGRIGLEQLRFATPDAAADAASHEAGGRSAPDWAAPPIGTLVGALHAAAHTAPLEQQEKLQRLLADILELFAALGEDGAERLDAAFARINLVTANPRSRNLLREIAIVTRDIYNALQSVSEELPLDQLSESSGGISEVVQRLHGVMERLDEAATQNLDHLEQLNRIAADEGKALDGVVTTLRASQKRLMQLKAEHPALEDALTRVQDRLSDEVGAPVMTLRHQLKQAEEQHTELISNQGFQELTGRTLRRIIAFIQSLEAQLYDILKQYRPMAGPRPTVPESHEESGTIEQSQDDVDRLLDELGF